MSIARFDGLSFSGTYSGSSSGSRCAIIEGIEYESTSLNMALFLNIGNGAKVSGIEIRNFVFNIQAPSIFVYAGIASENNGTKAKGGQNERSVT